jgi:long-subunit fatty acid transport protein
MGTGFAGRASSADDASTVLCPAGMARLKAGTSDRRRGCHSRQKSDIQQRRQQFPRRRFDGNMVSHTVSVPMGYYVKPIDDRRSVYYLRTCRSAWPPIMKTDLPAVTSTTSQQSFGCDSAADRQLRLQ